MDRKDIEWLVWGMYIHLFDLREIIVLTKGGNRVLYTLVVRVMKKLSTNVTQFSLLTALPFR